MSNLLDKSSIVLTASAYNNGKVLCVKPSDGSGDFDFSRNSAATRVNAQGLVEDVQILSSNLVQNGNFSQTGSEEVTNGSFANGNADWTIENTWTIGEGVANGNGANGSTAELKQTSVNTIGKSYKATFKVLNYVSGSVGFFRGSGIGVTPRTADGVYTEYFTATSSEIRFRGSNFNGSITNISVKEVGQNWFKDANWSIGDNVATSTGAGRMFQSISALEGNIGTKVKVSFNITEVTSGGVKVDCYGAASSVITEVGTHTFTGTTTNSLNLYINNSGTGNLVGSITNISVIEITDDTNLPRINYDGFSYQDALGSELVTNGDFSNGATGWELIGAANVANGVGNFVGSGDKILQRPNLTQGKLYKITFDILNYTSGTSRVYLGSTGDASFTATGNGTYSAILEAESSTDVVQWRSSGTTFIGSIDNCSVKEYLGQEVVPDSGCGSWLFEPQSTNLITYSEDFSQWQRVNIATEVSTTLSPDGISFMTKATFSASASNSYIRQNKTMAVGSVTSSIFVKKGNLDAFALIRIGSIDNPVSVWFNLDNGTVANSTGSPTNTSIVNYGNGVYRISATTTSATDLTLTSIIQSSDTSTGNPTENATQFYWGGQIEILPYATSYIPTDGTSVTRNQDDCTNGGSAASINSTSGVLYAEISALEETSELNRHISLSSGFNVDRLYLYYTKSGEFGFAAYVGGVLQANIKYDGIIVNNSKVACKYKENDYALWVDGVEVGTDTSAGVWSSGTLDRMNFANPLGSGNNFFYGKTKCAAVFPLLTDTELAELTTI